MVRAVAPSRGVLAAALALCVSLAACAPAPAGPPASAAASPSGGTLRVALSAEPASLDPAAATDDASALVVRQIYETLVEYDPAGLRIVPRLAESWTVAPDGRTWTFKLRGGVRFQDGGALDGAAVAFSLERARGRFDDPGILAAVEAPDAATVVVVTRSGYGPLLATLATPAFGVVSPACVRAGGAWATAGATCAAGTGPFLLRPGGWEPGSRLTLERNPSYWPRDDRGAPLPRLDRVVFRAIADEQARVAELRAGGLDVVRDLSASSLATVKGDPNLTVLSRPPLAVAYLGIAVSQRPFDATPVRRAIAMAVDERVIAQTSYGGQAVAASQLLPAGMLGYDDGVTDFAKPDQAAAKKAMADAGLASGIATELWYPSGARPFAPDPRRVAEAIAADLAKIGITAALRTEDWTRYQTDSAADRFPLWLGGLVPRSADPDRILGALFGAWPTPPLATLLAKARGETDATKRAELYKQVSKLVQQDVPRVPLVHVSAPVGASKKVRGLVPHATGTESFAAVALGG